MLRVLEINDIGQLQRHAEVWRELLRRTPDASFFLSLEWLTTYWSHFGRQQQLRILIVFRDEEPIGIVPLVVRLEDKKVTRLRVLTYPLHDWGSFYGPLGDQPRATLAAALRHVKRSHRDWDMIDLRWLPPEDTSANITTGAMQTAGFGVRRHLWKRVAVVDTSGSWEDYLKSRKQKFRNSIHRYQRRLAAMGEVAFQRYRPDGAALGDDDPHWNEYDECVALAARSWQGNSADGTTLSHDSVRKFLRDAHLAAVRQGCLDLNMLRVDGKLVAFAYNYHLDGCVQGLRVGFDPDYAAAGAGKVLWANTFRDSFQRSDRCYDIGPDSLEVKVNWLTRIVPVLACAHYRRFGAGAQFVKLAHRIRDLHRDRRQAIVSERSAAPFSPSTLKA